MTDGPLDTSIDQLKRVLDNQLSSVNNLKAQVGVLLGFAATSLVVLFSFGRSGAQEHRSARYYSQAPRGSGRFDVLR